MPPVLLALLVVPLDPLLPVPLDPLLAVLLPPVPPVEELLPAAKAMLLDTANAAASINVVSFMILSLVEWTKDTTVQGKQDSRKQILLPPGERRLEDALDRGREAVTALLAIDDGLVGHPVELHRAALALERVMAVP